MFTGRHATATGRRAIATLALIAALTSATARPTAAGPLREVDPAGWIQVDTGNFLLFSGSNESNTRRIGADLESLHSVLSTLAVDGEVLSPVPTKIYVFADDKTFSPFKPKGSSGESGRIAGYFHSAATGNYVAINGDPRAQPSATIYHEYLHYFARHNLPRLPLWLNEGLAEFYSTFATTETSVLVGLPKDRHLELLRQQPMIPVSELLSVDTSSRLYHEGRRRGIFYAQSWALVHYLLSDEEKLDGMRRFLESLALTEVNEPSFEEAFHQAFDLGSLELEIELERYIASGQLRHSATPLGQLAAPQAAHVTSMAPASVYYQLGDLLLRLERFEAAARLLREAIDLEPRHALAHAALGELQELGGNRSAAIFWLEEAVRLGSAEPLPHFLLGEILLRRVAETDTPTDSRENHPLVQARAEDLARARHALHKSIDLSPDFAPALAALGATYLFEPRPIQDGERGVAALERAAWLQPSRIETVFNLATLLSRLERFPEAESVVERVLTLFGEAETVTRARLVVAGDRLDQAAALVDGGRLAEGRAKAQELIDRTSKSADPTVRRFVFERGVEITRVASHNQALAVYRSAVDAANRGERTLALELLTQVEDLSRDSKLRSAARDLRRQLGH